MASLLLLEGWMRINNNIDARNKQITESKEQLKFSKQPEKHSFHLAKVTADKLHFRSRRGKGKGEAS